MSVYFPEQQHPRHGVVRAVVKDTSQVNNGSIANQMVYLDSDNKVADNLDAPMLKRANPMSDGRWHMVTVTTQPDSRTGFLMFLDGVEVGSMSQGNYSGAQSSTIMLGPCSETATASLSVFCTCARYDMSPSTGLHSLEVLVFSSIAD